MLFALPMLLITAAASLLGQESSTPFGFTALFNGKDLDGWHGRPPLNPTKWAETTDDKKEAWLADMRAHWIVEDGALLNDGYGVFLTTNKEYGDIEFLIDYKTVPLADSAKSVHSRYRCRRGQ